MFAKSDHQRCFPDPSRGDQQDVGVVVQLPTKLGQDLGRSKKSSPSAGLPMMFLMTEVYDARVSQRQYTKLYFYSFV